MRLLDFFLALSLVSFGASCKGKKSDPASSSAVNTATQVHTYQVRGVIKELSPDGKTVTIRHQEIPGYMPAMTMPFPVRTADVLRGLSPGDEVTFQMRVTADSGWIEQITRLGGKPTGPSRDQPAAIPPSRAAALQPGDAVPDFQFTNEIGQVISLSQFRGQPLALTFIFTRCPFPDFCPRMSQQFLEANRQLAALAQGPANWHLLSVSIDPEMDTPAVLQAYAERYHYDPKHWSFVTGSPETIASLAHSCGLAFQREGGSLVHNLRTVVLNPDGRVMRVFTGNQWTAEELAQTLVRAASPAADGVLRP